MAHTHLHTLLLSLCVCALDETIWLIFSFFPFLLLSLTHSSLCCSMFEDKKESKMFGYNLLCVGFLVFGSVLSIYVRFDSLSVSFKSERMKMLHLTADRIRMRTHQKRRKKTHTQAHHQQHYKRIQRIHWVHWASECERETENSTTKYRCVCMPAYDFPCAKSESNFEPRARQPYVNEILVQYTEYKIYRTHAAAHWQARTLHNGIENWKCFCCCCCCCCAVFSLLFISFTFATALRWAVPSHRVALYKGAREYACVRAFMCVWVSMCLFAHSNLVYYYFFSHSLTRSFDVVCVCFLFVCSFVFKSFT